ncbi:MAG: hypothetical protein R6V67_04005 [Spirochaetia bacterium]
METKLYTRPTRKRLKGFLGKQKFKKAEVYAELSGRLEDKSGKKRKPYAINAADGTV